jgi:hypothetical protein
MSCVPRAPLDRLIRDLTGDLHVIVAASENGLPRNRLGSMFVGRREASNDPRGAAPARAWNRRPSV